MNVSQWEQSQAELRKLEALLPSLPGISTTAASVLNTAVTEEEMGRARRRWLEQMIRRGWRFGDGGKLQRGEGRERVERLPHTFGYTLNVPHSWEIGYDPTKHCPAALMGGTYVRPGRFRLNGILVDANACARDVDECPECGTLPYEGIEHVHMENPNPYAPRWIKTWRWCNRCVEVTGTTVRRLRERMVRR